MSRQSRHYENIKYDNDMQAREFFYLVAQMRQAQRDYFKHRDQFLLRVARKLEGEVDREIARVKELDQN